MPWRVSFTYKAQKSLEELDERIEERILNKIIWLRDNFDQINPLSLSNEWQGFFKLRVGDQRIIYNIYRSEKEIVIHKIDRRDKVYKKK